MTLVAGTRLGAYEIVAPLGAGGMGEVYRARDTRLGREVAIKVVSERLLNDPTALARFEREARAVATLSHPNILAIHDFGSENGAAFAVMELLDGEPLDRGIATAQLSPRRALEIAVSIVDGLASAHAKGIVHRDLKPANVFITRDGHVKILDFGLAKQNAFSTVPPASDQTLPAETEPGVILGTLGYMSPEQVKGDPVDERTDIFSLGCVLYEMLSGRRPFRGDTQAETLAAILRDRPAALADALPLRIDALVGRCLEKDPDQRFQSARDLAYALREILSSSDVVATGRRTAAVPSAGWSRSAIAAIVLLAVLGLIWLATGARWRLGGGAESIRSLAVLPLTNLSGDPSQDYFADAMTEELTTRLAKMGNWRIASRTSVMGYKGTTKKADEIARELGVDALIEGSVIREGPRVKVTAQLIDGDTDRHIWAETYERELEGVLTIQNEVARAIAREVGMSLTPDAEARLSAATRPVLPAAYDAYVRGRHAWEKRSESDLRTAIKYFLQSIDADPTYAPAHAGLADCYAQLGYSSYISPEDAFPRARAAADKAIELDPSLADAHASLGYVRMYYDWNFADAESRFKHAIALNPNYPIAHQWYAYLLTAIERPAAEAEREISTARQLDPLSVAIHTDLAFIFHYTHRNDEALRSARMALEMNSKFPLAYFWVGRILTGQGHHKEAEAAFQNIGPLRRWTPAMAALGFLYAKSGQPDKARGVIGEFEELKKQGRHASSYALATIYAGLDDRERAIALLDAAYAERSHWLLWLKRDPRWDGLRTDQRFQALVRKVGLP